MENKTMKLIDLTLYENSRLHIVIYIKKEYDLDSQDYIVEIPIFPSDVHFEEFRQCIMSVFKMMFEGRRDREVII